MNTENLQQLEIRLSSNIELLKNFRKIIFINQEERNLSENDSEEISFIDVLEDLESVRSELDSEIQNELTY